MSVSVARAYLQGIMLVYFFNLIWMCPFPHPAKDGNSNATLGNGRNFTEALDPTQLERMCNQTGQTALDAEKRDGRVKEKYWPFTIFYGPGFSLTMLVFYVIVCLGVILFCRLGFMVANCCWCHKCRKENKENKQEVTENPENQNNEVEPTPV